MLLGLTNLLLLAISSLAAAQDVPSGILQTIKVDEFDPSVVYTAGNGFIYRSYDTGQNWSAAGPGISAWSIAIAPYDPVGDPDAISTMFAATHDRGVLRSNNGMDWLDTNGLSGEVHSVAAHPYNGQVFAGANPGIYVSNDLGLNWSLLSDAVGDGVTQGLVIDPIAPLNMYATKWGQGVYRSVDGGHSWVLGNSGLWDTQLFDLDLHPQNRSVLFASTPSGVFQSVDAGASWVLLNSPERATEIAIDPNNPNTMLVVTESNGMAKSTDGGQTWRPISDGLEGVLAFASVEIAPNGSGLAYAGSINAGIFVSIDSGETWVRTAVPTGPTPDPAPQPEPTPEPAPPPVPTAGPTILSVQLINKNGASVQLGERANFDIIVRNVGADIAVNAGVGLVWSQPSQGGGSRAVTGSWSGGVCDTSGHCALGHLAPNAQVTISASGSTSSDWVEDFKMLASAYADNAGTVTAQTDIDVIRTILTITSDGNSGGGSVDLYLLIALLLLLVIRLPKVPGSREKPVA